MTFHMIRLCESVLNSKSLLSAMTCEVPKREQGDGKQLEANTPGHQANASVLGGKVVIAGDAHRYNTDHKYNQSRKSGHEHKSKE
jgi:hypothetical protein